MLDTTDTLLAFRARATALVAVTTGVTSLGASTTGYTRTLTGLPDEPTFFTNGFAVGMELTPTGFTSTTPKIVSKVAADLLTIDGGLSAQSAASGRSLVVGLPALREWEDIAFTPIVGRPYVKEGFVAATGSLDSAQASMGAVSETGLYVLTWYGLSGLGGANIRRPVDALKRRFTPGTVILDAGGVRVRVRSRPAPWASKLLPLTGGWTISTLTVPWIADSINSIS